MPFIRGKAGQRGRNRWRPGCRHCEILEAYEAARDAWWARRESGEDAGGGTAGTANSGVGYYQLSDEEYRQLFPMPRFKDFLIEMAREPEPELGGGEGLETGWTDPGPRSSTDRAAVS